MYSYNGPQAHTLAGFSATSQGSRRSSASSTPTSRSMDMPKSRDSSTSFSSSGVLCPISHLDTVCRVTPI